MLRNLEGWRGTTNRNLNAQLLTALWGWNELVRENRAEQAVGDDGLFLPTTTEALSLLSSESTTDGLLTPLEMDLPKHEEWVRLLTTEPSYENLITQLRKHRAHTRYFKSQISLQLLIALTLKLLFKSLFTSQFTNETNGSHSVTADPKFEECTASWASCQRSWVF